MLTHNHQPAPGKIWGGWREHAAGDAGKFTSNHTPPGDHLGGADPKKFNPSTGQYLSKQSLSYSYCKTNARQKMCNSKTQTHNFKPQAMRGRHTANQSMAQVTSHGFEMAGLQWFWHIPARVAVWPQMPVGFPGCDPYCKKTTF